MLDLAFVRANLETVEEKLRSRGADPAVLLGDFHAMDRQRRAAITDLETLNAERNRLTAAIQAARKSGADATELTEKTRQLKAAGEALEKSAAEADERMRESLQTLPNLPQDSVPVGRSEHDNVVVKTWGEPAQFAFAAKPHWEIGEALGIFDFDRAAKISGARFTIHFGQGARLERALAKFMLDLHTQRHGYTEVLPPTMVNSRSLFGTGNLPKFGDDLFHCDDREKPEAGNYLDNDHWLIPTAEVPVTNIFRDETLEDEALPVNFCAFTTLLPVGGGKLWQGRARIDPAAPVPESGAGEVLPAAGVCRRA